MGTLPPKGGTPSPCSGLPPLGVPALAGLMQPCHEIENDPPSQAGHQRSFFSDETWPWGRIGAHMKLRG